MDPNQPASSSAPASEFDLMASELTKQVCCIKYSLMACNAFGIMLGIFVVLFGISYPEENFPGGYKGKQTAGISGFFIVFTLIGYYGAHRQKVYFLVPYSIIIFLFLGGNLIMWGVKPKKSVLDPDSNAVLILGGVFIVLMIFALWLAWQERKKNISGNVQVTSTAGTGNSALVAAAAANAAAINYNSTFNGYTTTSYQQAAANQFSAQFASLPLATQQQALALYKTLQSQPPGLCANSNNIPMGDRLSHRSSPVPAMMSMNHLSPSPYPHYSLSSIGDNVQRQGASNISTDPLTNRSRHGSNSSIHHSLSPSSHIQMTQATAAQSNRENIDRNTGVLNGTGSVSTGGGGGGGSGGGGSGGGGGGANSASVSAGAGTGASGSTGSAGRSAYSASASGHNRYASSNSEHARLIKNNHLNVLYQPSSNSYITVPARYNSERMLMY